IGGTEGVVWSATAAAVVKTLSQAQTYTGPTLINGSTLSLVNSAALYSGGTTGSSSLTINRGGLTLDNTGSQDVSVRIPTTLAISLGGGTLSYLGRAQWTSTETLGAVTTTEGANTVNVTNNATGISSAQL